MDSEHFDRWTRTFSRSSSRRRTLAGLVLGAAALGHGSAGVDAGPGCKNVGVRCRKHKQCCSNVCAGPKGKPRLRKCRAHDVRGCKPGQDTCGSTLFPCVSSDGVNGRCVITTGNAPYCAGNVICEFCSRDVDCQRLHGPGAACISCADCGSGTSARACATVDNLTG